MSDSHDMHASCNLVQCAGTHIHIPIERRTDRQTAPGRRQTCAWEIRGHASGKCPMFQVRIAEGLSPPCHGTLESLTRQCTRSSFFDHENEGTSLIYPCTSRATHRQTRICTHNANTCTQSDICLTDVRNMNHSDPGGNQREST